MIEIETNSVYNKTHLKTGYTAYCETVEPNNKHNLIKIYSFSFL